MMRGEARDRGGSIKRWVGAVYSCAIALGLVAGAASSSMAQEGGGFTFEAHGGLAVPAGALADVADLGGTVGGTIGYLFHPNFGWRAGVEGIFLDNTQDEDGVVPSPAMNIIHFMTGPEIVFPRPADQAAPMTLRLFFSAGAATIDASETFGDGSSVDFDHTYLTFNFGGAVGYQITPAFSVFVDGRAYLILFDEQDTAVFAERSPFVSPFANGWVLPVTAGVRLRLLP